MSCQNKILGKPTSIENAKATLKSLRGKNHSVFTGVSLLFPLNDSNIIKQDTKYTLFNLEKILLKTKMYNTRHNKKIKTEGNGLSLKVERLPFGESYISSAIPITSEDLHSLEKKTESNDIIIISFVEETHVTFSSEEEAFSDEVIDAYVATGEPM